MNLVAQAYLKEHIINPDDGVKSYLELWIERKSLLIRVLNSDEPEIVAIIKSSIPKNFPEEMSNGRCGAITNLLDIHLSEEWVQTQLDFLNSQNVPLDLSHLKEKGI